MYLNWKVKRALAWVSLFIAMVAGNVVGQWIFAQHQASTAVRWYIPTTGSPYTGSDLPRAVADCGTPCCFMFGDGSGIDLNLDQDWLDFTKRQAISDWEVIEYPDHLRGFTTTPTPVENTL